jgi:beta-glucanase (GH16 family)
MLKGITAAVAACVALTNAQTFTSCNPLKKSCPPNPAVGNASIKCDFTKGACSAFTPNPGTTLTYGAQGALFSIANAKQGPTIASTNYIFFGRIDVELIASTGQGVVTSVVLQSSDLDEIDWEWLGGDTTQGQSNYFGKGDTTTYDRGAYHAVTTPQSKLHTYSIDWNAQRIQWIIDGVVVRTVTYQDAKGGTRYPQTPMQIKLGTWVAGLPGTPPGTVQWAGGLTNFAQAPFNCWIKSVNVVDYAGGSAPSTTAVKEYVYGDMSGSWQSIKIIK